MLLVWGGERINWKSIVLVKSKAQILPISLLLLVLRTLLTTFKGINWKNIVLVNSKDQILPGSHPLLLLRTLLTNLKKHSPCEQQGSSITFFRLLLFLRRTYLNTFEGINKINGWLLSVTPSVINVKKLIPYHDNCEQNCSY